MGCQRSSSKPVLPCSVGFTWMSYLISLKGDILTCKIQTIAEFLCRIIAYLKCLERFQCVKDSAQRKPSINTYYYGDNIIHAIFLKIRTTTYATITNYKILGKF
jgi:hypothetical protein